MSPSLGTAVRLPTELYYPICAQVASRRDLCTLAATTRVLQRPSETALHRQIALESKDSGRKFILLMKQCPRFAPLVRNLQFELSLDDQRTESGPYWSDMRDVLGQLSGLESLVIDDGRDACLSWILSALPDNRLKVLRCAFVLDTKLLTVLRRQSTLEELSWTGAFVALRSSSGYSDANQYDGTPRPLINSDTRHCNMSDPDVTLISITRQYLQSTALPCLKLLHSESLAFARAIVPGRAVTHLWVPGSSFAAAVTSDYKYRHINSAAERDATALNPNMETSGDARPMRLVQLAHPQVDLSSSERAMYLCRAIEDFSLSRDPVLSLRMALDLPRPALADVLSCISRNLPGLRVLGFLPASMLDPSSNDRDSNSSTEMYSASPLPYFRNLHTICLWSTPSRSAVLNLDNSPHFPSLRTLTCLHFSPAFEWLCLPINNIDGDMSEAYHGGIQWECETEFEGRLNTRRRFTAIHDPENLLWRDV